MVQETIAVKYYAGDAACLGLISDHIANSFGAINLALNLSLLANLRIQGGGGYQSHTVEIINQLSINVPARAKNT